MNAQNNSQPKIYHVRLKFPKVVGATLSEGFLLIYFLSYFFGKIIKFFVIFRLK